MQVISHESIVDDVQMLHSRQPSFTGVYGWGTYILLDCRTCTWYQPSRYKQSVLDQNEVIIGRIGWQCISLREDACKDTFRAPRYPKTGHHLKKHQSHPHQIENGPRHSLNWHVKAFRQLVQAVQAFSLSSVIQGQ
jgi:hypothetical protein